MSYTNEGRPAGKTDMADLFQENTTRAIEGQDKLNSCTQPPEDGPHVQERVRPTASVWSARTLLLLSCLFGYGSLLCFAIFLFYGPISFVRLGGEEKSKLSVDACLCLIFFIQHSVMIRRRVRQWMARFIKPECHSALYSVASGIVLLILVVLWQESDVSLYAPEEVVRWSFHTISFLSIMGFVWCIRTLRFFDPVGRISMLRYLQGKKECSVPLVIRGPYRWVRHPMHLCLILIIWSSWSDLGMDRLLFNVFWTGWIAIGTVLEERDLIVAHGDVYRRYKRSVPMLIGYRLTRGDIGELDPIIEQSRRQAGNCE